MPRSEHQQESFVRWIFTSNFSPRPNQVRLLSLILMKHRSVPLFSFRIFNNNQFYMLIDCSFYSLFPNPFCSPLNFYCHFFSFFPNFGRFWLLVKDSRLFFMFSHLSHYWFSSITKVGTGLNVSFDEMKIMDFFPCWITDYSCEIFPFHFSSFQATMND